MKYACTISNRFSGRLKESGMMALTQPELWSVRLQFSGGRVVEFPDSLEFRAHMEALREEL